MLHPHFCKSILISIVLGIGCAPPNQKSTVAQQGPRDHEAELRKQVGDEDWRVRLKALEELDSRRLLGQGNRTSKARDLR